MKIFALVVILAMFVTKIISTPQALSERLFRKKCIENVEKIDKFRDLNNVMGFMKGVTFAFSIIFTIIALIVMFGIGYIGGTYFLVVSAIAILGAILGEFDVINHFEDFFSPDPDALPFVLWKNILSLVIGYVYSISALYYLLVR